MLKIAKIIFAHFVSIYSKSRRATQILSTVSCSIQKKSSEYGTSERKKTSSNSVIIKFIYIYVTRCATILKFHENSIRFQSQFIFFLLLLFFFEISVVFSRFDIGAISSYSTFQRISHALCNARTYSRFVELDREKRL